MDRAEGARGEDPSANLASPAELLREISSELSDVRRVLYDLVCSATREVRTSGYDELDLCDYYARIRSSEAGWAFGERGLRFYGDAVGFEEYKQTFARPTYGQIDCLHRVSAMPWIATGF